MTMNNDTIRFIKAFGFKKVALRTFSDRKSDYKGIEKKGSLIRCNICGEFKSETDIFLGLKNRPICKSCSSVKIDFDINELSKWEKLLWYKNKFCRHGVHLSINGAHKDNEVDKVYAHFFEIDDKSMEEQWELIQKLKVEPSIIVKTRKSYHVYFLIKDGNLKRFREIQQRLAYTFGGDMQKKNESTCMRVPGYYHNKKDPIEVKLIKCNEELVYTQSELVKGLDLLRLPEKPKKEGKFFDFSSCKDELINMVYSHIRDSIFEDRRDKFIMSCINSSHKDSNPSAVFFKDSLYFYCSGCGYSSSLYDTAKEQGWYDIINYIEERRNIA